MIRRALTNTGWLMGARGINAVLSPDYPAMATRALGLEGFGNFILCVTFAQAITGLASFQTWQAVVRWGQRHETQRDAVGFALALDLLAVAGGGLAGGLLLGLAGDWLPVPSELRESHRRTDRQDRAYNRGRRDRACRVGRTLADPR